MKSRSLPLLAGLVVGAAFCVRTDSPQPTQVPSEPAPVLWVEPLPAEAQIREPGVWSVLSRLLDSSIQAPAPAAEPAAVSETGRAQLGTWVYEEDSTVRGLMLKREVMRKVAHLLELAYMACDQKNFDRCVRLCDEILRIDPDYTVARELREEADTCLYRPGRYAILSLKVEHWKQMTDDDEEAVIPGSQTFRFPSRDEWAERTHRGEADPRPDPQAEYIAIWRTLNEMRISFEFRNTLFEDVLAFIRDYSGLNIILDAAVRGKIDPDLPLSVSVRDLPVGAALSVVLGVEGTGYVARVTEERVVLLTH